MMKVRTVSDKKAYDTEWEQILVQKNGQFCFRNFFMGVVFLFYLLFACYVLFFERLIWGESSQFHKVLPDDMSYWQGVRVSVQLCPLKTIQYFARWLHRTHPLFPLAFKNLVGNLVLFFPMGIFMPYFFKKQRNPFCFFFTLTVMIFGVEITQALTLLGKCDIDDYILNMLGAAAGFICFQVLYLIRFLLNLLRKKVIYARWK